MSKLENHEDCLSDLHHFYKGSNELEPVNWSIDEPYVFESHEAHLQFKKITGFNNPEEQAAYNKGYEDAEDLMVQYITNYNGYTNSSFGQLIHDKVKESIDTNQFWDAVYEQIGLASESNGIINQAQAVENIKNMIKTFKFQKDESN